MTKRRRSRGSGSVSKSNSGIYYYYWVDANGKKHKKSLRTRDRSEAKERAKEHERGVYAKDQEQILQQIAEARQYTRKLPLDQVWQAFLATKPTASAGTLGNYKRHLKEFFKWLGNNYPSIESFSVIPDDVVTEYCDYLWQSGISANTYNYKKNSVGHITKKLMSKYGIPNNKWLDPDLRKAEVKQSRKPLTCTQAVELLKALDDDAAELPCPDECRVLVKFLLYTGARLADAVYMQWVNINLDKGGIEYIPRKTASKGKVAELPIMPPLYNELEMLHANKDEDESCLFPKLIELYERNSDGLKKPLIEFIQDITGDGRAKHNGNTGQRKINRAAYGIHSLRTTFATQAAMAGAKSLWLSKMLGDSLSTVDKYYLQAGYGDTLLAGFNDLPQLTDGTGKKLTDGDKLRAEAHDLIDSLPIKKVKVLIKQMRDSAAK